MDTGINHKKLIELFEKNNIEYELMEHQPEGLSEKIAAIRGNEPQESCKSILLRWKNTTGKGYILANVPGNLKVDIDKIKQIMKFTELRMAGVDELLNITGCRVGEVPPFGELFNLETIFDEKLFQNTRLFFNAATLEKSIKIEVHEFKKLVEQNDNYTIQNISI